MTLYDTERIIRKQNKYVKSRAYIIINSLESKKLNNDEILACIQVMLTEDNSEIQIDILNLASKIILNKTGDIDENPTT